MSDIYTLKFGEKYPININIRNRDEDKPVDLTGSIIRIQIKDELKDNFFILEKTISEDTDINNVGQIVDALNGHVIVKFNDEDYENIIIDRIYYITIWWDIPSENFSKVISSNGCKNLKFKVCHP